MSDNNEQVHQQLQDALQNMDNRNGGGGGGGDGGGDDPGGPGDRDDDRPLGNLTSGWVQREDCVCDLEDPRTREHHGNQLVVQLAAARVANSNRLLDINYKRSVAAQVVHDLREHGGRFLGRTKRGTYREFSTDLAERWVSTLLRWCAEEFPNGITTTTTM